MVWHGGWLLGFDWLFPEGGTSPNFWWREVGGPAGDEKWTQGDLRFCKNEGSKRSKNCKKGVNKIENQGENWYKFFKMVK